MLEMNNISYYLENEEGIENVKITFSVGNTYSIIGPAHSGQLALAHVLANLAQEKTGLLYLDKMPVEMMDRRLYASKVSVMRNVFNFDDELTVLDNLRNYIQLMGKAFSQQAILEKLTLIGFSKMKANCKVGLLDDFEIFRLSLLKSFLIAPPIICLYSSSKELTLFESEGMLIELIRSLDMSKHAVIFISNDEYVLPGTTELWGINKGNVLFIK